MAASASAGQKSFPQSLCIGSHSRVVSHASNGGNALGPNYVATVKYHMAAQAFLAAEDKLKTATREVRGQQTRVDQLEKQIADGHQRAVELSAKAANLDGDVKAREARIEELRTRQANITSAREYQAILVDISTQKIDKGKVEDEAIKAMDTAAKAHAEVDGLRNKLEIDKAKLQELLANVDARVTILKAEIETARTPMEEAAKVLPARYLEAYERAARAHDGDALAPLEKPNARTEEYVCSGCNTYLVTDIYNRIHNGDELVLCPNCGRILYIPDDLPPERAIGRQKPEAKPKAKKAPSKKKKSAEAVTVASDGGASDAGASVGVEPSETTAPSDSGDSAPSASD
jgi:predicted  nucleic acid-binding Zn-ribbon protein